MTSEPEWEREFTELHPPELVSLDVVSIEAPPIATIGLLAGRGFFGLIIVSRVWRVPIAC